MYIENQNIYNQVDGSTPSEEKNYDESYDQTKSMGFVHSLFRGSQILIISFIKDCNNLISEQMYSNYSYNVHQEHFGHLHDDQYRYMHQHNDHNQFNHDNSIRNLKEDESNDRPEQHSKISHDSDSLRQNIDKQQIVSNKKIIEDGIEDIESKIILETGPGSHQIKEYNIRPVNILKVNYTPSNSDILVVKLMCDPDMKLKDSEFFLTALSPKYQTDDSDRLYLPNLKISKDMLKGRTKGYKFNLVYSLFIKGEESFRLVSEPFFLWSNVNQTGFPREERDSYLHSENKKRKRSPPSK